MSSSSFDLQSGAVALLQGAPDQPALDIPVIFRRPQEKQSDIEAAIASAKICIYVMPPLPARAAQGTPFVFFESYEFRVRIVEQPALNDTGVDVYDLMDFVALTLHWSNPGGILAAPLELAPRPVEMVEDPAARMLDIIFSAPLQINRE